MLQAPSIADSRGTHTAQCSNPLQSSSLHPQAPNPLQFPIPAPTGSQPTAIPHPCTHRLTQHSHFPHPKTSPGSQPPAVQSKRWGGQTQEEIGSARSFFSLCQIPGDVCTEEALLSQYSFPTFSLRHPLALSHDPGMTKQSHLCQHPLPAGLRKFQSPPV